MKNLSRFIVKFVIIYLVLSLPMILGFGVEIDFISGISWIRKAKAYFVNGILDRYLYKILISLIASIVLTTLLKARKNKT